MDHSSAYANNSTTTKHHHSDSSDHKSHHSDAKHNQQKPSSTSSSHGSKPTHQPSTSELLSNAKLVAEATLGRGSEKVDKAEVAGAAANILNAASHYGKLDDKKYGNIVEKAEIYLQQYSSTSSTATTAMHNSDHSATTTNSSHSNMASKPTSGVSGHSHASDTKHSLSAPSGHGDGKSGGKYGEYIKMAEDYLHKNSSSSGHSSTITNSSHSSTSSKLTAGVSGHSHASETKHSSHAPFSDGDGKSGGKYGEYIKMAENYLHKNSSDTSHLNTASKSKPTSGVSGHSHSSSTPSSGGNEKSGGKYGDYIKMAEDYLHKPSSDSGHSSTTTNSGNSSTIINSNHSNMASKTKTGVSSHSHSSSAPSSGNDGKSGGKYGEYIKMAEDYLDKPSSNSDHSSATTMHSTKPSGGGDHVKSEGGYGDLVKKAEGLLKKF